MQDRGVYTGATVKRVTSAGEEVHVRHGHGTYTYSNATFTYTGDWCLGVKHGHGVFSVGGDSSVAGSLPAHSVYEGTFLHGEMTGHGLKRWRDGTSYSGGFHQGAMHGEGIWLSGGAKYEGGFRDDRRDGAGMLTCGPGPTEFRGNWFQHQKHGEGRCRWADGSTFEGTYSFDLPDGQGQERLADGSTFVGRYHNGLRQGHGSFAHGPTGLRVEGDFDRGTPMLRPVLLKLRVPKPPAETPPPVDLGSQRGTSRDQKRRGSASGKDSPTNSGGASGVGAAGGSTSKLSKKKQEELRKASEELTAYRATLTEGVVSDETTGAPIQLIDEGLEVTVTPGAKLPSFYLCACTSDGTVAASESGRTLRITIKMHPIPIDLPEEKLTSRSRHNADLAPSAAAGEIDPDDVPIVAFCTCPGARTVEWHPKPPLSEEEEKQRAAEAERLAAEEKATSASGKKKKAAAAAAAPSTASAAAIKTGSGGKRRSQSTATAVVVDGPPPPFVCTGECTRGVPRDRWQLSVTRTVHRGYCRTDELWLAGACTPGLHIDMTVEDVTPGIETPPPPTATPTLASRSNQQKCRSAGASSSSSDELGPPPSSLTFHTLQSYPLKLLTAGVPPKLQKKKTATTKKPTAAIAGAGPPTLTSPKAAATAAAH